MHDEPMDLSTPLGPISLAYLTESQISDGDVRVLTKSVESDHMMPFPPIFSKNKALNIHRCYRLLIKRIDYSSGTPRTIYVDAVIPEHHNKSGLFGSRPGSHGLEHVCLEGMCSDSVRLIPVGREDLLEKLATWWYVSCADVIGDVTTIVIEQSSYDAQRQIIAAGFTPKVILDYLQFCISDVLITCYQIESELNPGLEDEAEELWTSL